MTNVVVTAKIKADLVKLTGQVTLSGNHPPEGPQPGDTFAVETGDKLTWTFLNAAGTGAPAIGEFTPRVRVAGFTKFSDEMGTVEKALIDAPTEDGGKTFKASNNVIVGQVAANALRGRYKYAVELVRPGGPTITLDCLWEGAGGPAAAASMGGGEKGPRPPKR